MTWNPNVDEEEPLPRTRFVPFDFDTLDDGRCKASSWRVAPSRNRPTYESYFGPGGFNRCIGPEGHANHLHKDEWNIVFALDPFRTLRKESS